MQNPNFVSRSLAITIHLEQIEIFGGTAGIRDEGLLVSALAQPRASFFGELLHPTIHEQAAAYLFHLAKNHPFVDGNKRTAFAVMVVFLGLNGYSLNLASGDAYNLVIQVATGAISKAELAIFLEENIRLSSG
ncbi:type II toxin-antitoxin system death-on-curing family toxin [Oscillatoria salina]|uniref:type II toxin-antitoxin system death-on-curing family toxin n=1 Tax=Oscillatoria salina TaxID=331517 RepID=UPI001CCE55A3|nr:type II toxin-antitoxin system death-on-curing family toxin [Oscillatoria salina]MBZ8179493.1 type II toxin-antitoxin system death-on-curing family toxin [Oscillatoria salina IIICB1]